jgi:O-antigen ligase
MIGARGRTRLIEGLALGGLAAALAGLAQSLTGEPVGGALPRAHAFVHPVAYGEMMGFVLLGGIIFARDRGAPGTLFVGLCASALVFNQTRAVLVAVLAGVFAAALASPRWRRPAAAAAAAAVLVALAWEFMPTGGRNLRNLLLLPHDSPHHTRLALWKAAWTMFRESPAWGVGHGGFGAAFARLHPLPLDGQSVWSSAHNLYLHQLAERGAVGAAALAAFLGCLWSQAWSRARNGSDPHALWGLACVGAMLVMGLTETAFQTEQVATLLLAAWSSARRAAGDEIL